MIERAEASEGRRNGLLKLIGTTIMNHKRTCRNSNGLWRNANSVIKPVTYRSKEINYEGIVPA